MRRKNFHITEPQYKALMKLQNIDGLTTSEHIRRALDAYLEEYAEKLGENIVEFNMTEFTKWLANRGSDE